MKLKSIFQSSPTSHILVDKNLIIKAFNKAAFDFISTFLDKEIEEGDDLLSFISPAMLPVFLQCIQSAFAGHRRTLETKMAYAEGVEIWWEMKFNPVYDHTGDLTGVSIDSTNVTDAIKDKQYIMDQNTALREIAQIQSHEIRRPVANIIELSELINDKDDEDFDQNLKYIKQEILCLDRKIHDIVALSSIANTL